MGGMTDPHGPLRGDQTGELLRLALQASGLDLVSWQRTHLFERPGAETTGIFAVTASSAGRTVSLHLIGSTVELTAGQRRSLGAVRLSPELSAGLSPGAGGASAGREAQTAVHFWPHPTDPALPGLPAACDPSQLGDRISAATGEPSVVGELSMLVLRPLRRAVLRASVSTPAGSSRTVFVKVLRPERSVLQLRRHALAWGAPGAVDLGEGLIMLEQAPGLPLTEHLHQPGSRAGTDSAALARLTPQTLLSPLDRLGTDAEAAGGILSLPRRAAQADRLEDYAGVAVRTGADPLRVRGLCRGIRRRLVQEHGPPVPTHGDFHPANIFFRLEPGREGAREMAPSALIDVDTLGPGRRADDLACLLAHLLTLPTLDADGYTEVPRLAEAVRSCAAESSDAADLGARTAGVLLSLLPSAQTAERGSAWLDLAERSLHECD